MDLQSRRHLIRQTAEDFEWLENYCRLRHDLSRHAGELHFAAALVRNVLGPSIEQVQPPPLHIAVIGGAGAGKSTVVNFLIGQVIAEANPQAGYTRHPTAFLPEKAPWPAHLGYIGQLRRLEQNQPANLDQDVYQVRSYPAESDHPLRDIVVWDCPDMTTWAASTYAARLTEIAALCDLAIYIASDERYNDEIPTQYLSLMLRAGKAVMVVLTKMQPDDAPLITEHFRNQVLARITTAENLQHIPIVALPMLPPLVCQDPAGAGSVWRAPILNQLLVMIADPFAVRQRTIINAGHFLTNAADGLLQVARTDLIELDAWKAAVRNSQTAFEQRYRNELIAGEPFRLFEQSQREVMRLLEMPGSTHSVSAILSTIRFPMEWLVQQIKQFVARPEPPAIPERDVLTVAFAAWIEDLQANVLRRASEEPVWKQLASRFESGLKNEAQVRFSPLVEDFQQRVAGDIESAARRLPESLSNQPNRLSIMRGAKLGFEIVAIILACWGCFHYEFSLFNLLWLVPVSAFLANAAVGGVVGLLVHAARRKTRDRREQLLRSLLSQPLAEWLAAVPLASGTSMERLHAILMRVPASIRTLANSAEGGRP